MLLLTTEDQTLRVELSGAANAVEPSLVASFVDVKDPDVYEPGAAHAATTGATPVVIVPAPTNSRRRQLKFLSVYNEDDMDVVARVFLDDDGTERTIVGVTLAPGAALIYTDGVGFRVITLEGVTLVGLPAVS